MMKYFVNYHHRQPFSYVVNFSELLKKVDFGGTKVCEMSTILP